jgi:hypothetical protein
MFSDVSEVLAISIIALMMEAVGAPETLVNFCRVHCANNPEEGHLWACQLENLKSQFMLPAFLQVVAEASSTLRSACYRAVTCMLLAAAAARQQAHPRPCLTDIFLHIFISFSVFQEVVFDKVCPTKF